MRLLGFYRQTNIRMFRLARVQLMKGQRSSYWLRVWRSVSRSSRFKKWWTIARRTWFGRKSILRGRRIVRRTSVRRIMRRVNLPRRATLYLRKVKNTKSRLALQYLLGFSYRTHRGLYNKVWGQVRKNQNINYWVKYFFTRVRKANKFRGWYKSIIVNRKATGVRRVVTRFTGSKSKQVNLT